VCRIFEVKYEVKYVEYTLFVAVPPTGSRSAAVPATVRRSVPARRANGEGALGTAGKMAGAMSASAYSSFFSGSRGSGFSIGLRGNI
jgi:hypothetical protein